MLNEYNSKEDEELMMLITQGNNMAFDALMHRHMKMLFSIVYRMRFSTSDAEDILQETFLKVWKKPQLYNKEKGAAVSTWLYKITYNLCLDQKRKAKTTDIDSIGEIEDQTRGADDIVSSNELSGYVAKAMESLPASQRAALILCHYEGLSNTEAATIMNKSVKAIESLLVRARKHLHKTLSKDRTVWEGLLS